MKITVCDVCRKEGTVTITIPTQFQPDVAGGPSELVGEDFDLCIKHTQELLKEFTERSTKNEHLLFNQAIVSKWLNRTKKIPIYKRRIS